MMQHKFDDISKHVSLKGMLKLDRIAEEAAKVARWRESASLTTAECSSDSAWVIVQVAYGRELAVESAMMAAGVCACVVMRKGPERKRRYRILPAISMPVFNGLVFVYCSPSPEAVEGIRSFDGVKNILMSGGRPFRVDAETICDFKQKADNGHYDWKRIAPVFAKGQKVRVLSGPFSGFVMEIAAFAEAGEGDAVVTTELFGKPMAINISLADLEKV
ncbi:transcription termination/antitermination protein NusG [Agrobacterium sp. Azo12]|uniref:transcription termination/antitermination protein NusG n=1 Tax=Agrobacterium sp. Azo12 TaxID=3031129 RepID=UPI0023D7C536|nr:transcription termination/antitermination NusG family protein [Agrobacterium sp. Azo12]MDO5895109.1 transcription termination/antitermination NusG family protein [Agrobacterium sp. Azo12]